MKLELAHHDVFFFSEENPSSFRVAGACFGAAHSIRDDSTLIASPFHSLKPAFSREGDVMFEE